MKRGVQYVIIDIIMMLEPEAKFLVPENLASG
jgi:hypothetical protein